MSRKLVVYFVLPCYNEEKCLKDTTMQLLKKYDELIAEGVIDKSSRIVYVDDGSKDGTWGLIDKLSKKNKNIVGVKLAHNVGHQNALFAGLMYAKDYCDASISMDADLQDDLSVIDGFLSEYNNGYEIVYGVRNNRKTDSRFKRWSAQLFYKMMAAMGVEIIYNSADCRLMSRRAMEYLGEYSETNLFLRGIVPTIGLSNTTVEYVRNKRILGESKYPLKKMFGLAWNGVTSFSVKPIRMVFSIGIIIFIVSIIALLCLLIMKLTGSVIDNWVFFVCSIWVIAGMQMISTGLVGEYVGKIYAETKRRPRYLIDKIMERK